MGLEMVLFWCRRAACGPTTVGGSLFIWQSVNGAEPRAHTLRHLRIRSMDGAHNAAPSQAPAECPSLGAWQHRKGGTLVWEDYAPAQAAVLEEARLQGTPRVELTVGKNAFEVDLREMVQIKKSDPQRVRKVRRLPVTPEERAAEARQVAEMFLASYQGEFMQEYKGLLGVRRHWAGSMSASAHRPGRPLVDWGAVMDCSLEVIGVDQAGRLRLAIASGEPQSAELSRAPDGAVRLAWGSGAGRQVAELDIVAGTLKGRSATTGGAQGHFSFSLQDS